MKLLTSLLLTLILTVPAHAFYKADIVEGQALTDELAQELGMIPVEKLSAQDESAKKRFKSKAEDEREAGWRNGPDPLKAEVVLVIDKAKKGSSPSAQTMKVYYKGDLIETFKVSTGKEKNVTSTSGRVYRATTPVGYYRPRTVWKRYQSSTWVGADMDFAVFFNGGIAIHSTIPKYYPKLGRRASGGCVRLHRDNAKMVNELILSTGLDSYEVVPRNRHVGGRTIVRHKVVGSATPVLGVYRKSGVIYNVTKVKSWDTLIVVKNTSK